MRKFNLYKLLMWQLFNQVPYLPKSQTRMMHDYYNSYLEWLEKGAPHYGKYSKLMGLCHNAEFFSVENSCAIKWNLDNQFIAAGLNVRYPFGGVRQYQLDYVNHALHLNSKRIAWVKAYAQVPPHRD